MTTTPTIWKAKFTANINGTTGNQSGPTTIGLANGNFLVVWEDTNFGPGVGRDIMGQLFDPLGNPVGLQFQVNQGLTVNNEFDPRLAAMPDGGFVMTYISNASGHNTIGVERYDSNGVLISSHSITGDDDFVSSPDIAVSAAGDYVVVFSREIPEEQRSDVHAVVYNGTTNDPGTEHLFTAQNGEDDEGIPHVDTFSNGDIIAIYRETDGTGPFESPYGTVEVRITSATGAAVSSHVEIAGAGITAPLRVILRCLKTGRSSRSTTIWRATRKSRSAWARFPVQR